MPLIIIKDNSLVEKTFDFILLGLLQLQLLIDVTIPVELRQELNQPVIEAHLLVLELFSLYQIPHIPQETVVGALHELAAELLENDANEQNRPRNYNVL